jgi:hypothetical protein
MDLPDVPMEKPELRQTIGFRAGISGGSHYIQCFLEPANRTIKTPVFQVQFSLPNDNEVPLIIP